jgi:hypothetical protein
VIAVAALAAAASLSASRTAAAQTHPTSPCSGGRGVASACQLTRYFDALKRGNAAAACSLLGSRLLSETGGVLGIGKAPRPSTPGHTTRPWGWRECRRGGAAGEAE